MAARASSFLLAMLGSSTLACADDDADLPAATSIEIFGTPEQQPIFEEYLRHIGTDQLAFVATDDPAAAAAAAGGPSIALASAEVCAECYRLRSEGDVHTVGASGPLGMQYGLTDVLEALDVRFFAPHSTYVPPSLVSNAAGLSFSDELHEPDMTLRGVQLHTLHPIEGLWAFWVPSPENLEEAKIIADWYLKQRTNYIQWVALDDILLEDGDDPAQVEQVRTAWRAHTIELNDYLERRGLRSGVNIQIFGSSNLQQSFDLLDERIRGEEQRPVMRERLGLLLDGTGFDHVTLSFGEFFEIPAIEFIDAIDRAASVVFEILPEATMGSKIHLGNYPNIFVDYMGQSYLFYFLAQFADARVVPWVHSVMYYNLYEDAGGAYLHEEFDLHRDLLLERLAAGQPVAYFPETSYWIAFDNSVPMYDPVYMKSRFIDLDRTRERAAAGGFDSLRKNVTFSTGVEWGYWQNDYAYQRMTYELADDWRVYVDEMFSPFGADGATVAEVVIELGELQHRTLIGQRLAPYFAGRDASIDLGDLANIFSQPDRVEVGEIATLDPAGRAAVARDIDNVAEAVAQMEALSARLADTQMPGGETWLEEIRDGLAIDVRRGRFVVALYRAALGHVEGGASEDHRAQVDAELAEARAIVARRHASLHNPRRELLLRENTNPTVFQYGYLFMADTLCYWDRERVKLDNLLTGGQQLPPPCFDVTSL